ncbi:MAG: carboxypeptidase-like regulatory domain-containing protein [bacterium]
MKQALVKAKVKSGIILFCLFLLLWLVSCWQEQHHQIIPAELPNYPVRGRVLSSADGTPVRGAVVMLGDEIDTTDATGTYFFDHVLGGKDYTIEVTKDYFEPYSGSVEMDYDTLRVDDILLGKIFYHLDMYNPGAWGSLSPQGLVWRGANLWSADSAKGRIIAHNYDSYMSVAEKYNLPRYPIPHHGEFYIAPLGLEWCQNNLLTYDDQKDKFYELTLTAGDTVLIKASYKLPAEIASAGDLWDLTWDGYQLWSCSPGAYGFSYYLWDDNAEDDVIYQHNQDLSVTATFPTTEIDDGIVNPTGIAWDGEKFWLNSRGTRRLYMLDENLHVLGYYVFDEPIQPWAPYQLCWGNGYLWGCFRSSQPAIFGGGTPTQYIYKFGKLFP